MEATPSRECSHPNWVAVVAHDLRAPITIIRGYARWLERLQTQGPGDSEDQTEARRCVQAILESSRQLNRLVSDLVDMSSLEAALFSLRRREVDLPVLIREIADRSAELVCDHPLRVTGPSEGVVGQVDPDRVEQILANVLSNAAKYGTAATEIRIDLAQTEDEFRVSVTNDGPGIATEYLTALFGLHYRTPDARNGPIDGLGLGLYICKALVEAHGGRIWAESTPGATTTVAFALPVAGR
jgi:signal transduction histidine kinase